MNRDPKKTHLAQTSSTDKRANVKPQMTADGPGLTLLSHIGRNNEEIQTLKIDDVKRIPLDWVLHVAGTVTSKTDISGSYPRTKIELSDGPKSSINVTLWRNKTNSTYDFFCSQAFDVGSKIILKGVKTTERDGVRELSSNYKTEMILQKEKKEPNLDAERWVKEFLARLKEQTLAREALKLKQLEEEATKSFFQTFDKQFYERKAQEVNSLEAFSTRAYPPQKKRDPLQRKDQAEQQIKSVSTPKDILKKRSRKESDY